MIRKVYAAKKEIYKEMHDKQNEADNTNEEEGKAPVVQYDFVVGEEITEDHVQAEIDVLRKAKSILIEETKQDSDMKVDTQ